MALFRYTCPKCRQPSLIDPDGYCQTKLRNGSVCGYGLPISYNLGNHKFRSKVDKHTSTPPEGFSGTWSWVDNEEQYSLYHYEALKHGTVSLNLDDSYLFLWHTPLGEKTFSHVMYGDSGTVIEASGVVSPLNSKLQNIHSHFSNWEDKWVSIAAGHDLIIQEPAGVGGIYTVHQSGETIASFDPNRQEYWCKADE